MDGQISTSLDGKSSTLCGAFFMSATIHPPVHSIQAHDRLFISTAFSFLQLFIT
jgi:hypothetical protein